ncbi:hypothetical protein RND81_10G229600 [Saponaria officinalis]|uniref:DUF7792 domain-containing protein n=1 Tax=Saponaria officinalis TaxID=3572 RepID=A0AAW1I7L6_SAPOF
MAVYKAREKTIEQELALPFHLTNQLIKAAAEATTFRTDCLAVSCQAADLSHKLRSVVGLTLTSSTVYHRPICRIAAQTTTNLHRALKLVRKCKQSGILRKVVLTFTSFAAEFEKVTDLLGSSIADFRWLLSVFHGERGSLVIPPIARNDPVTAAVWSLIAWLHVNRRLNDRIVAANNLAALARSNHQYRDVIVEEGAVRQLLVLLSNGGGCTEGQVAAAAALNWLAVNNVERCRAIAMDNYKQGITIIVKVLEESCVSVQILVAELVAKIVDVDDEFLREEFGREDLIKSLISCLIHDSEMDECIRFHESPESKHNLMTKCSSILWKLCEKSLLNCRKIAEPESFLCLAKIIETERGELRLNCLMTVMEVAEVAEGNVKLRKTVWNPNSLPAKAVLDQLRRLITEESNPIFLFPAIKSIGCLARIFPAKDTNIVGALVRKLGDENMSVATEAVIVLTKFTCPENHNCVKHSKTMIEFNGVPMLMKLMRVCDSESVKLIGLVLLCFLSIHVGNSEALAEARVLITLESAVSSGMALNCHLKDIISRAINQLVLYQD